MSAGVPERVPLGVRARFDYDRAMRFRLQLAAALIGFATLASFSACDANLETRCVGGDGSCDVHPLADAASSSVGGGVCLSECDITTVSDQTGEFPCAIEAIMTNCRRCHTEVGTPLQAAPFPLDTYEQSQQLYFDEAIYYRMKHVVEIDFMPLEAPLLTEEERTALIDDWICNCAPPREPTDKCN